jgi:hypothetical protein
MKSLIEHCKNSFYANDREREKNKCKKVTIKQTKKTCNYRKYQIQFGVNNLVYKQYILLTKVPQ